MVEDGVVLVDIGLFTLDGVLPLGLALLLERGRDHIATDGVDAEQEA